MLNVMKLLQENHVKYGLIMCGLIALCLLYMYLSGSGFDNKSPLFIFVSFIAPAFVWYFGIREKKKLLKNKITFKQGLKEGFKISLVFGIVSPFIFLAYYFVNPVALDYVRSTYGLTQSPTIVAILIDMAAQFISAVIFGTIYGAIISFFLKTK
jgi:hypothetical protein